jgi:hypothetical protein
MPGGAAVPGAAMPGGGATERISNATKRSRRKTNPCLERQQMRHILLEPHKHLAPGMGYTFFCFDLLDSHPKRKESEDESCKIFESRFLRRERRE